VWTVRNAHYSFILSLRQLSPLQLHLHTGTSHLLVEETEEIATA